MSWFEALILGIVQGLTEYLPVSSSGHLAIGSALFGIEGEENLAFTIVVHVATVFSTLVVLWKEIDWIFRGLFKFQMNAETKYVINILISMIPIGIVGVFFKDTVEQIFGSGLLVVGCMLLLTAALLAFSYYAKPRQKESISMKDAFIIGLAQACAVMPGLSRSGSTIATGLLLGNNKAKLAQFSFLMVIPPILGEALLDVMKMVKGEDVAGDIPALSLAVGFVAAFVSGCVACKWMINIVKKGKLIYFAIYCAIAGLVTIACTLLKKPLTWTSFDLVNKFRYKLSRKLKVKKIKVGHAGTLDPLATGVMIVCTGRATKRIDEFQYQTKEYIATLKLGETTPSFDLEKEIDAVYPTEHITRELVEEVLKTFVGTIQQIPPVFSACKIEGKRAYELARKGEEVELKSKTLVIDELELLECDLPVIKIRVVCSKGTYIRALARDIGKALNSGAHLIGLERTRIGEVTLDMCMSPEEIDDFLEKNVVKIEEEK